jgi:hypothetical protein
VVTVELAVRETVVAADTAAERLIVEEPEVTCTLDVLEVKVAPEFVIAPDPERVIVPRARIVPVGATAAPPEIRTVPAVAVKAPDPAYAPVGFICIEPAEVVTAEF